MSLKVTVKPGLLRWARERAALDQEQLAKKVGLRPKRVAEWEETGQLPLAHLQRLAEKTHTPVGFLFLEEPPTLDLPIADFRSKTFDVPSPDLLETVYLCEQRQEWFREHATNAVDALSFVGSAPLNASVGSVAASIRETIGLDVQHRAQLPNWGEALRDLFERVESAGILMMRNGIVGNNTHRPLSVNEFRGFALSDRFAPLIFVNAADSKSAQMFTVAHELVHIWRGESGISDAAPNAVIPTERYCNQVAAELLIPMQDFSATWRSSSDTLAEVKRLARVFKVSSLVVLIRAREADALSQESFNDLFESEVTAARDASSGEGGGDFYRTQKARLGERFAAAVIASAVEGDTPYTEAFQLLGVRKLETFNEFGRQLGVIV